MSKNEGFQKLKFFKPSDLACNAPLNHVGTNYFCSIHRFEWRFNRESNDTNDFKGSELKREVSAGEWFWFGQ